MGLFGVMTDITFKVEPMVIVKTENDFSLTVEDLFYDPDCLKKLHDDNWSVEIFWFPFNSCLLYTSPSPRDATLSRMPSSA